MKKQIILGIKGFIIGIANIIPGVSGGTLAITLGLYEELINAITHFFTNLKKNILFLLPIGIGAVLSIALLSNVISIAFEKYAFMTTLFFVGLIAGGVPLLFRQIKNDTNKNNYMIMLVTFLIVMSFTFIKEGNSIVSFNSMNMVDFLMLFVVGIIAAATMVIPGISGSFVLMLLGYYKPIIDVIKELTRFENVVKNLLILVPFGLGVLIGIIIIAKIIEYLLKKFKEKTYYGIIGFVLASMISIMVGVTFVDNITDLIGGIILFMIGSVIAYKLGDTK